MITILVGVTARQLLQSGYVYSPVVPLVVIASKLMSEEEKIGRCKQQYLRMKKIVRDFDLGGWFLQTRDYWGYEREKTKRDLVL